MSDDFHARLKKETVSRLLAVQHDVNSHRGLEDLVYRFYLQSFKTYRAQEMTRRIVEELRSIAPQQKRNEEFLRIVDDGTGKEFTLAANKRWLLETRPILEALFHATYFLDMAVKYMQEPKPEEVLVSGYTSLLTLRGQR